MVEAIIIIIIIKSTKCVLDTLPLFVALLAVPYNYRPKRGGSVRYKSGFVLFFKGAGGSPILGWSKSSFL